MDDQQSEKQPDTRVWFGGVEVQFMAWTEYGLVYTRVGSMQTLANLTKSTVRRLLRDGTLRLEGYRPDWANPDLYPDDDTGRLSLRDTLNTPDRDTTSTESTESPNANDETQ